MSISLKSLNIFLLLGLLTICVSCSGDEKEPTIDDELLSLINSFIEEGRKRGVELSTQGLEARLVTEFSMARRDWVCGYGRFVNNDSQMMEILSSDNCWNSRNDIEKENLIYHELGHALLGRQHLNQTLPNQATQKSIMCSEVCSNFAVFYKDGPLREYYLDELFDENLSFPNSIANKPFKKVIYEEEFEEDNADYLNIDFSGSQNPDNFQVQWDSTERDSKVIYGLGINSKTSEKDSVIVFKSFDLVDFMPHSNLKATAKIVADEFDGQIDFRITLQDDAVGASLIGISYAERTFENIEINGDLEVEIYSVPEDASLVTISFIIHSNDINSILVDKVQVDLLE